MVDSETLFDGRDSGAYVARRGAARCGESLVYKETLFYSNAGAYVARCGAVHSANPGHGRCGEKEAPGWPGGLGGPDADSPAPARPETGDLFRSVGEK